MTDKNGIEIKTGAIVEITGAYFKRDNGLYFVENSPGDPNWCGSDHCLKKISRAGKISTAKYNICFWPIGVYVNDRSKRAEAVRWNAEHAAIEVKTIKNMGEVVSHFQEQAAIATADADRLTLYRQRPEAIQLKRSIAQHYEAVAQSITV